MEHIPEGMKKAYYRSIPAYFNPDTGELVGRSWIWNLLVDLNLFIDLTVLSLPEVPIEYLDEDELG